jgi:hypothetical protein
MIGFKAFIDTDQDIIAWWDDLPPGQRSEVLRTIIRDHANGDETEAAIMRQLDSLRLDMSSQFRAVLQKIGQVAVVAPQDTPVIPAQTRLSEEEIRQREQSILRRKW